MNKFVHGLKTVGMYCVGVPIVIVVGLVLWAVCSVLYRGGVRGIDLS